MLDAFKIVEPVEFSIGDKQSVVYIPVLKMLQALLNRDDILDKVFSVDSSDSQGYNSFRDGSHFKENTLLM